MTDNTRQNEAERLVEQAESTPAIVEAMRAYERFAKLAAVQVTQVPSATQYATGGNS